MDKSMLLQCEHCKDWFEPKVINAPVEMFEKGLINLQNSKVTCSHCNKKTTFDNKLLKFI